MGQIEYKNKSGKTILMDAGDYEALNRSQKKLKFISFVLNDLSAGLGDDERAGMRVILQEIGETWGAFLEKADQPQEAAPSTLLE